MEHKWLFVDEAYERLMLIEEGVIKVKIFDMDETSINYDYDREAELEVLKERMAQVSHSEGE